MFLLDTNVVSELRKVGDGTVHGMTVVTGNRTDFEASGVAFIDPWAEC